MTIKVSMALFDELISMHNCSAETFRELSGRLASITDIVNESMGFSAEHLSELLRSYVNDLRHDAEKFEEFASKTTTLKQIYERVDRKALADVKAIPIMTHNNILSADVIMKPVELKDISLPTVEQSSLISNNTVMYDDWMLELIAKEYIKEIK